MYGNRFDILMNTFDDFVRVIEHRHGWTEWYDDQGRCWITFWVPGTSRISETVEATN
jgi:hypothetical protein